MSGSRTCRRFRKRVRTAWKRCGSNVTYFLKAVVPVAQEFHVRLALHPNEPPAPMSRGSGQIMGSLAGWKRLVDIVKGPSNGITFDWE